jgi:hypothetical protein
MRKWRKERAAARREQRASEERERLEAAKAERLGRVGETYRRQRELADTLPPPSDDSEHIGTWAAERADPDQYG